MNEPNPPPSLRAMIVAAYPAVRAGLRAMIDGVAGISVIGEAAHLEAGGETDFAAADVLVIDLDEGADATALGELALARPMVLLAAEVADFAGFSLAEPLARAYLLKEAGPEELAAAVAAVAQGLVVADPAVAAVLAGRAPALVRAPSELAGKLSERELEVLRLVASGLPNKGIALQLGISDHTVKFHVGAILGKLNAASRTEAVTLAVRGGLLPL